MPRKGITRKQVATAVTDLKTAGIKNPSIRMIRERLGEGSLTSITRHRQAIDSAAIKEGIEELPDTLEVALKKAASVIWLDLARGADEIIAGQRSKLQQQEKRIDEKYKVIDAEEAVLRKQVQERNKNILELERTLQKERDIRLDVEKKLVKSEAERKGSLKVAATLSAELKKRDAAQKQFDKERSLWVRQLNLQPEGKKKSAKRRGTPA